MANRLIISVEFSKNRPEEVELYQKLQNYSNAGAIIKDILKGVLPLEILKDEKKEQK